ncbi:MAG: phosphoribosylformylglycinamidine synthase subunit PurQ [Planctomycetaceae bacterium]
MAARPRVCVLRAPGTNCDVETAFAFETAGAAAERVHLFRLLEQPQKLADYQMLCIPGGFSYGDDVGAGVIFSQTLQSRLVEELGEFLQRDTLLLGICNGFQVLLKAGLLPDGAERWPPETDRPREATLTWNDNGKYTAVWVHLRVHAPQNVFLRGIETIEMPIAHAEGKIAVRELGTVTEWRERRQIALCYCEPDANGAFVSGVLPFPHNPNGSVANIAGLGDPSGRVLGLMPHPERFLHATQHPQWTRRQTNGAGDGVRLFRNAVTYFE